jgi:hypothetical protein
VLQFQAAKAVAGPWNNFRISLKPNALNFARNAVVSRQNTNS